MPAMDGTALEQTFYQLEARRECSREAAAKNLLAIVDLGGYCADVRSEERVDRQPLEQYLVAQLPLLCAILASRIAQEQSEEVKQVLVAAAAALVRRCANSAEALFALRQHCSPILTALYSTLENADIPPIVATSAVEAVECFAVTLGAHLGPSSTSSDSIASASSPADVIGQSMLPLLQHRHARVRIGAIKALRSLILHCRVPHLLRELTAFRDPNLVPIKAFYEGDRKMNYMAALVADRNSQVVVTLLTALVEWSCEIPDRAEYGPRISPYVWALIARDTLSRRVVDMAISAAERIGALHHCENAEAFDEKLEWNPGLASREYQPADDALHLRREVLPEPFVSSPRPSYGARMYASNMFFRIHKTLLKEIREMAAENVPSEAALASARLLRILLVYLESNVTQFAASLIHGFVLSLLGTGAVSSALHKEVLGSARLLGWHLSEKDIASFLLPNVSALAPTHTQGAATEGDSTLLPCEVSEPHQMVSIQVLTATIKGICPSHRATKLVDVAAQVLAIFVTDVDLIWGSQRTNCLILDLIGALVDHSHYFPPIVQHRLCALYIARDAINTHGIKENACLKGKVVTLLKGGGQGMECTISVEDIVTMFGVSCPQLRFEDELYACWDRIPPRRLNQVARAICRSLNMCSEISKDIERRMKAWLKIVSHFGEICTAVLPASLAQGLEDGTVCVIIDVLKDGILAYIDNQDAAFECISTAMPLFNQAVNACSASLITDTLEGLTCHFTSVNDEVGPSDCTARIQGLVELFSILCRSNSSTALTSKVCFVAVSIVRTIESLIQLCQDRGYKSPVPLESAFSSETLADWTAHLDTEGLHADTAEEINLMRQGVREIVSTLQRIREKTCNLIPPTTANGECFRSGES